MEAVDTAGKFFAQSPKISFADRLRTYWQIYCRHRNVLFNAKVMIDDHTNLRGYFNRYVNVPINTARLLELGCGQTAVQTALFRADGAHITGIDTEIPSGKMNFQLFIRIIRQNGAGRALRSLIRHVVFDGRLFSELSREYGRPVVCDGLDLRVMDAASMAFDSESFDFIYSKNVFEHLRDVPSAVRELLRVLKPSGVAVICIHLFPSLSGGHCLEWANYWQPSKRVPPWDHLRENKHPADIYLNKLTIQQYREILQSFSTVVEETTVEKGENFLSKEIEAELGGKGYSRHDLLTNTVTFVIRKKIPAAGNA